MNKKVLLPLELSELPFNAYQVRGFEFSILFNQGKENILPSDITRLTNEVNRMMEQSKVEFKTIANSILECASAKFDCCSVGENDELTQVILEMYAESQTEKGLDEDLIAQTVDEIVVDENGKITLRLKSGAEIKGEI